MIHVSNNTKLDCYDTCRRGECKASIKQIVAPMYLNLLQVKWLLKFITISILLIYVYISIYLSCWSLGQVPTDSSRDLITMMDG